MGKKLLIIFGIFLIIIIVSMTKGAEGVRLFNTNPNHSQPICYDSDSGFKIYEPGRIFLGGVFSGEDYCQKYVYLHEFVCNGANVEEIIYHCTGGGCDAGACFVD